MNHRKDRLASMIVRYVSEIIQFELKNPKLGFVTVTSGKVSQDHEFAKIFVSFIPEKDKDAKMDELAKSRGFIRTSLAKRLDIYKIPDLVFVYDDTHERVARVEAALKRDAEAIEKK
jgi:ribosome-binding factor A